MGCAELTDVLVLDVAPGLGVDLCLCVGFLGEVLDEHFLMHGEKNNGSLGGWGKEG